MKRNLKIYSLNSYLIQIKNLIRNKINISNIFIYDDTLKKNYIYF